MVTASCFPGSGAHLSPLSSLDVESISLWSCLLFLPACCRPRGPRAASAFPAGSGLWLLAQLQGLRMAPGGTSLAPSWAEPDKMDCAAHSPDPEGSNWADRFLEGPRRPFPLLVRGRPEDQSHREIERCLAVGFEDGGGRREPRNAGWKKTRGQTLPKSPQRERSPASALPLAS